MKSKSEIRPERLYNLSNTYKKGEFVVGIISQYNLEENIFYVDFPNDNDGIRGFIRLENFIFPSLFDDGSSPKLFNDNYRTSFNRIPNDIFHIIGHQIYGKIINRIGNLVEISRRETMKVAFDSFSTNIGCTIIGCIENVIFSGIFVDIGNGLTTFIHVSELSVCKYFDAKKYFSIGDTVQVKIIDFDEDKKKFLASRKQAYIPDSTIIPGCIIIGTVCEIDPNDDSGYHVECGNPATFGIMDISYPNNVSSGQKVCLYITKKTDKCLKGTFLRYDF